MPKTPTFISFYTTDDYYRSYADRLTFQFKRLNADSKIKFEYDFRVYNKKPGDTWSKVTFAKPSFIRECMDKYEELVWVDIDSTLVRLPTAKEDFIIDSPYDLAAVSRSDGVALDYLWYVRRTPATIKFFEQAAGNIANNYAKHQDIKVREGGDHYAVLEALEQYKRDNPDKFYLIGDKTFGSTTGWITYGISGNETRFRTKAPPPKIPPRPSRNIVINRKYRPFER